jgi:hypothetical protein
LVATTALSAQAFNAGAVGPVSLQNGFPVWWQDDAGLRIGLCLGAGCIPPAPVNVGTPFSRQVGFGAEAFWWGSNALFSDQAILMECSMEAAWFGEDAVNNQQLPFARMRVRAPVTVDGPVTITSPCGTFTNVPATVAGGVNFTEDIPGAPTDVPPFSGVLTAQMTHFLTLGQPIVKGAVFAGTGPIVPPAPANTTASIVGAGINASTTQFDTAGFAFNDGNNVPPVAHSDVAGTAVATPVTMNLTANDVDVITPLTNVHGVNPLAVGLGAAPPFVIAPGNPALASTPGMATAQGGRVAKNDDGTVTYLPAAAFSGVDSFPYVIQDTGGCISGQATTLDPITGNTICLPLAPAAPVASALAIVTVEQATAQAAVRTKVQKWEISGTSSISALQATDAAGNPILFTKLIGAQEVPPQISAGSGDVSVTIRPGLDNVRGTADDLIDYTLSYSGLISAQQSHIHNGSVGSNGGPVVFLCSNTVGTVPACPATGGTVTGTLTVANLIASAIPVGLTANATFAQLVADIMAGNTYVNVHTTAVAGGEIRGQIGRNVVAAYAGPTTAAPVLGITAVPPLAGQTSAWSLPTKLDGLPSADRTVTIQTSAGSTVTVPLKIR